MLIGGAPVQLQVNVSVRATQGLRSPYLRVLTVRDQRIPAASTIHFFYSFHHQPPLSHTVQCFNGFCVTGGGGEGCIKFLMGRRGTWTCHGGRSGGGGGHTDDGFIKKRPVSSSSSSLTLQRPGRALLSRDRWTVRGSIVRGKRLKRVTRAKNLTPVIPPHDRLR